MYTHIFGHMALTSFKNVLLLLWPLSLLKISPVVSPVHLQPLFSHDVDFFQKPGRWSREAIHILHLAACPVLPFSSDFWCQ